MPGGGIEPPSSDSQSVILSIELPKLKTPTGGLEPPTVTLKEQRSTD